MSHRHILPGNILTGQNLTIEGKGKMHKHKVAGGEQVTSATPGDDTDNHRHTVNGQGTSPPVPTIDSQLVDKKMSLEKAK